MKVKVKDIAKVAGVSNTAVSLVLNGRPCRLSEATKEHILQVARELQFKGEGILSDNKLKKVRTIGFILPGSRNTFFEKLAEQVSYCLLKKDYVLFHCYIGDCISAYCSALESLVAKNVDGIIVIPPAVSGKDPSLIRILKLIQNNRIPMILVDRAVYSVFCDFITSDNKYGGKIATEYLIKNGHRVIGCITGNADIYTVRRRIEGYKQALAEAGLSYEEDLIWCGQFDCETGYTGIKSLIEKEVTAVVAGNDEIARGVYLFAKEQGLNIPKDLSIIGFDNSDVCDLMNPPLSSLDQNIEQMAERVADVILHNIENVQQQLFDEKPRNYYFTPILIERESVEKYLED